MVRKGSSVTDPYERMKVPTPPTQPWQIRHKWLLVLARLTKLILFPLYVLFYFPVVWPFMLTIGYLFWGSATHFVKEYRRNNWSDPEPRADWDWWTWGELETNDD